MKEQLKALLRWALHNKVSDIHFRKLHSSLDMSVRIEKDLVFCHQDIFDGSLYDYLRFISGMNLCEPSSPQSGAFSIAIDSLQLDCRFSSLKSQETETGVLRLLHTWRHFRLEDLTTNLPARALLSSMLNFENGLVISCGPTGSGKSTTIHALLKKLAEEKGVKIVSLEDPIEIRQPQILQLQVSLTGLSYEQGIEELMRHDPDVIFLGECRSAYAAKMAIRAALTGTLVFATLHAANGRECVRRLEELGVNHQDLLCTCKGIFAQRLEQLPIGRKECVYEIWKDENLQQLFKTGSSASPSLSMEECRREHTDFQGRTG